MIVLEIHRPGGGEAQLVTSDKRVVTLGRHSRNDVHLDEDSVSRFHAEVEHRGEDYFVRDLDSRNGVFVNLSPVLEHRLTDGDEIRLGAARVVFHVRDVHEPKNVNVTKVVCLYPAEGEGQQASTSVRDTMEMPAPGEMAEALAEILEKPGTLKGVERTVQQQALVGLRLAALAAGENDLDTFLGKALQALQPVVRFTRGAILVREPNGSGLSPRASFRTDGDVPGPPEIPVSMTIVNQCLNQRKGICCRDPMSDPRFAHADSVVDLRMRSVLCVPILGRDGTAGVMHLDSAVGEDGVDESGLPVAMLAANLLARLIEEQNTAAQRDRQERRGEQSRLLAAAAHAFQSIYTLSEGQLEALREAAESGDSEQMNLAIDRIAEGRESFIAVLEGIHDYLRGRVQDFRPVQYLDVLAEALDELAPAFEAAGVDVRFDTGDLPREAYFDAAALRMLFLNLMTNALEALDEAGDPTLQVSCRLAGESRLSVVLQDNGRGMSDETRRHAFDPFFTTKSSPHAGLGLTYARHIVQAHGGTLAIESTPGTGTTVTVTLPVRMQAPVRETAGKSSPFASWLLDT